MDVPTLDKNPGSKIHLIGGEKGGVGKSLVARVLAQHFIDQQLPFIGFDTDRYGPDGAPAPEAVAAPHVRGAGQGSTQGQP